MKPRTIEAARAELTSYREEYADFCLANRTILERYALMSAGVDRLAERIDSSKILGPWLPHRMSGWSRWTKCGGIRVYLRWQSSPNTPGGWVLDAWDIPVPPASMGELEAKEFIDAALVDEGWFLENEAP